jgi:DNA-directed RNA polymerase subunit RPC12/RpoP
MNNEYSNEHHERESQEKGKGKHFICRYCGRTVSLEAPGTQHRNHCPLCLRSVHLDNDTGDRAAGCGGIMEPIAISVRQKNEWMIIHRCTRCGALKGNRIAGDDNEVALLSLAVRPVAQPPFPLDGLYNEDKQ